MWELLVCLEGELDKQYTSHKSQGRTIQAFLRYLHSVTTFDRFSPELLGKLNGEIPYVHFRTNEEFGSNWAFSFAGKGRDLPDPLAQVERAKNALIVSPFVDRVHISHFVKSLVKRPRKAGSGKRGIQMTSGRLQLVCRPEEAFKVEGLFPNNLETFVFTRDSDTSDEEIRHHIGDLHAKMYAIDDGISTHLWIGSANATRRAWCGKNVEAMVYLQSRQSGIIDRIVKGFGDRLRKPGLPDTQESDEVELALRTVVDVLRRLRFRASWHEDSKTLIVETNELSVLVDRGTSDALKGCTRLRLWLGLIEDGIEVGSLSLEVGRNLHIAARSFTVQRLESVPSGFLQCKLYANQEQCSPDFIVQLEMPRPRLTSLIEHCRQDLKPSDVSYLLWGLLGETMEGAAGKVKRRTRSNHGRTSEKPNGISVDRLPDVEDLLHACVSDPSRSQELKALAVAMEDVGYRTMLTTIIEGIIGADVENGTSNKRRWKSK